MPISRLILSKLAALSDCSETERGTWLRAAEDSVSYLQSIATSEDVVIYATTKSVLIHGVLVPTTNITPPDGADLQHSMVPFPDDSWRIQRAWGGGQGHHIYLEGPLSSLGKSFRNGEKLIYRRSLSGVQRGPSPIELSQKLVHSLDIYWLPERNAYCRLDSRGDIEEVITIYQRPSKDAWDWFDVVAIRRKDLDKYMAVSGTSLVIKFDFTRVPWGQFNGWGDIEHYERSEPKLFYHGGVDAQGSFANGAFIIRSNVTVEQLVQEWIDEEDPKGRRYATFKIYDRKNGKNVETSCAPEFLSNYFQKSDLPWEISPAFFRPDVLLRFKADPDKYTLEDRSIACRGAWHLETYDINEAGQVHTYVRYLAQLPYEEQLYWQSFNEWPRGPISKRAYQTDIRGDWDMDYDPLNTLKRAIRKLDESPPEWWQPRGEMVMNATRYPATDSPKEWADELLALDQLLVEGFLVKPLRNMAEAGGRTVDPKWGSIRVLHEVLLTKGLDESDARDVIDPIQRLHALRTIVKGHATQEKKREAELAARSAHGSFRAHFTRMAADCDRALSVVLSAFAIDIER